MEKYLGKENEMSENEKKDDWKEETLAEMGARMGIDPCGEQMDCAAIGQFTVFLNLDGTYGGPTEVHEKGARGKCSVVATMKDVKKWMEGHKEVARLADGALKVRQEWLWKWKHAHREGARDADRGCVRLKVGETIIDLPAGGDCAKKPVYALRGVKKGQYPWPRIPPTFRFMAGVTGHVEVLGYDCDIEGELAGAVLEAENPEIWIGADGEVLVIEGVAG